MIEDRKKAEKQADQLGNTKIWLEEPTGKAAVYTGWLTELKAAEVKPHREMIDHVPYTWLTLNEIAEQLDYRSITVIVDTPLKGVIYHYGNHGNSWEQVGTTVGYA